MKKISILMTIVLLIVTCGNVQFAKANDYEYRYDVVQDGSETPRKAWFKNGEELPGNPGEIEECAPITIATTPDDSCAAYLATISAPTSDINVEAGVTVTFGSEDCPASVKGIACHDATVTVYAEGGDFVGEELPGSLYGVTCFNSTVTINGNVENLWLGDEFKYDSSKSNNGNVVVNGNVRSMEWHTTSEYTQGSNGTEYYRGFVGDVSVTGIVGRINIYQMNHSNILDTDIKGLIKDGTNLQNIQIKDGVWLNEPEDLPTYTVDTENFYYEYAPVGEGNWHAIARYIGGAETNFYKEVTFEELKDVLTSGTEIIALNRDENVREDLSSYNVSKLTVYRGGILVNNVTTTDEKGYLMVHSYRDEYINVDVKGNVDELRINYVRANENMNINVDGNVTKGEVYKFTLQSDTPIYLGSFTCSNMEIYKDGVWNPDLFLSLGTTEYHPVDDAVLDEALGLEKNIQNGSDTITQMADMFIEEVESDALGELENNDDFSACVDEYEDAEVLTGVEIELQKFDYNESTKEITNQQVVTELGDKDLAITVKVPEDKFEEGKDYIIIREHDNRGTREMDVLVPRRDGNKLTFKTNKFSSFIIVEVADNFQEDEPIDTPIDTPSDEPTDKPSDEPTDTPSGGTTDKPSDGTTDKPSGGTTDKPSDGTTDKPSDGTTDTPNGGTTDSPESGTTDSPESGTTDDSSNKKEESVVVELKNNSVVTKEDFSSILEENASKDVVIKLDNYVSFEFAKGSMKSVDGMDKYDFTVTINETYKSELPSYITQDNFVAVIDYSYSGKLPGQANIKIPVGKEYVGKTLYYSLMKDDSTFDEVQTVVVDADGFITVKQDHCSSYVITTEKPKLNETTITDDTTKPGDTTKPTAPIAGDSTTAWLFVFVGMLSVVAVFINKKFNRV